MQAADRRGELHREQPFVISVLANQIKEEYDSREEILIQGIMDAYFEEEGELVLVDYKTCLLYTSHGKGIQSDLPDCHGFAG